MNTIGLSGLTPFRLIFSAESRDRALSRMPAMLLLLYMSALYPNDRTLVRGWFCGSRSLGHTMPDLCCHDRTGSPLRPWTSTRLVVQGNRPASAFGSGPLRSGQRRADQKTKWYPLNLRSALSALLRVIKHIEANSPSHNVRRRLLISVVRVGLGGVCAEWRETERETER